MKLSLSILVVFVLFIIGCGCGGLGGQGISINIRAQDGSTVSDTVIEILIDDGGTDLGGFFYRSPKAAPTTQPEGG